MRAGLFHAIAAALLAAWCNGAAAQVRTGADLPSGGGFPYSGIDTADQCMQASVSALQGLGYRIRQPRGTQILAQHPQAEISLLIDCTARTAFAAANPPLDTTARQQALNGFFTAFRARVTLTFDANGNSKRVVIQPQPANGPWYSGPINPRIAVLRFDLPLPSGVAVRCLEMARGAISGGSAESAGSSDAVWIETGSPRHKAQLNCGFGNPRPTLLARTTEAEFAATERKLADLAARLQGRADEAAAPPDMELELVEGTLDRAACVSAAEQRLRHSGYLVRRIADGVAADSDILFDHTMVLCGPGGQAAIIGARYLKDDLVAAVTGGAPASDEPRETEPNPPQLGTAVIVPHDLDPQDCADAFKAALAAAGYGEPEQWGDGRRSARKLYSSRAGVICGRGWAALGTIAWPLGGLTPAGETTALRNALTAEVAKPRWISNYSLGVPVRVPRTPTLTERGLGGAAGKTLTSRYAGATFVASVSASDAALPADARLDAVVAALEREGLTVQTTRKALYRDRPAVAVWGTRTDADGRVLRSVARYVVDGGRIAAVEVLYPDGVDVAAAMATFTDSLFN